MRLRLAAVAVGAALGACSPEPPAPPEVRPVPVAVAPVESSAVATVVAASGRATTARRLPLAFVQGGRVAEVRVDFGDAVGAGDTLAALDATPLREQAERAAIALDQAARDLQQARDLYADSAVTRSALLDAGSRRSAAASAVREADDALRHAALLAPAAGRVAGHPVRAGQVVTAGQAAVELVADLEHPLLRVGVSDRDIAAVAVGDSAGVRFDAYPDAPIPGRVVRVAAAADGASGLFDVDVLLAPSPHPVLPGMVGHARLVTGRVRTFASVPIEALVDADGERGFVYVLDGSGVERRAVVVADLQGGRVLLGGGVAAGERVVVEGAPYLRDRSRVTVTPGRPP